MTTNTAYNSLLVETMDVSCVGLNMVVRGDIEKVTEQHILK